MVKNYVSVLVVGLILSIGAVHSLPSCFISIGDWGSANPNVEAMSLQIQNVIASPQDYGCSNIELMLSLGDNFYPDGVSSIDDPKWKSIWVDQFRSKPGIDALPVYSSVGDHDYNQLNPQQRPNASRAMAQVQYHQVDPLWFLPDTNYTFNHSFGGTTILFVVLDTEAMYTCLRLEPSWCFKRDQAAWFNRILAEADNDPSISAVVVVGHHALVCPLGGHYDPKLDDLLVPIGRNHRVSLFLTGHSHFLAWSSEATLTKFPQGEMWYIINGAGRGAGAYPCTWQGLRFQVANPVNKSCFPAKFNDDGGFLIHRVTATGFDHCAVDSLNGTMVLCQETLFRG